ncbi:RelA/SpoT family protein [gut metagenome]|uniref:RelA/SpoT family protein n=1 Tax=gut metagenome TaxID=749906 RepID=J9GR74_9ZZZZ
MLAGLMKKFQVKTVNAFYAAVGDDSIDVSDIKEYITDQNSTKENAAKAEDETGKRSYSPPQGSSDDILVIDAENVRNIDYKMAKCCNPVYGDDVFGFVSIKDGIKIHRISCPNAARLIERYPYRIQKVRWSDNPSTSSFQTNLKVTAAHEAAVINEVVEIIGSFKASIRSFNFVENQRTGTYEINLTLSIPSNLELDKIISKIRLSGNVYKVTRG